MCPLCHGPHSLAGHPGWRCAGKSGTNGAKKAVWAFHATADALGRDLRKRGVPRSKSGVRYPRTEGSNPSLSAKFLL